MAAVSSALAVIALLLCVALLAAALLLLRHCHCQGRRGCAGRCAQRRPAGSGEEEAPAARARSPTATAVGRSNTSGGSPATSSRPQQLQLSAPPTSAVEV